MIEPLQDLLCGGADPHALVWGTTLLCLGVALLLRLNPLAVQVGNLAAWPLQLLLAYPYCRLGSVWFDCSTADQFGQGTSAGVIAHLLRSVVATNSAALRAWTVTAPLLLPLLYFAGYRLVALLDRSGQ